MSYAERAGGNFYLPELFRMKGEILQAQDSEPEMVEQLYREAVSRAQSQSAKWWELRASVSLARFLQRQGRTQEAYPLLREIIGWFQEGSDTPDLMQARALLAALP
jgi:predicted ATPase